MKRHHYPHFQAAGYVGIFEHGSSRPDLVVGATCYLSYYDEVHSALVRDAKWRLERLGMPADRIAKLYFEEVEITNLYALDAKGVKQPFAERVEAFRDDACRLTKRATLIRQRRLVPEGQREMLEIYGPKVAAPAQATAPAEAVPA